MKIDKNFIIEVIGRAILLLFYFNLLRNHSVALIQYHKISSLLYIVLESLILILVLFRAAPVRFSASPWDWLIALAGTLAPILIQPTGNADNPLGIIIQLLGMLITSAGVISLNKSFGVVPAEREIKTMGMYKFVRHPLYLGYLISNLGVLLNHFSEMNCFYIALGLVIQIIRITREEKFLSQNPSYVEFKQTTRWRLVPYIW